MVPPIVVGVTLFAAGGGFLFGYDLGAIAGALPSLKKDPKILLTDDTLELAVGGCKLGACLGALAGIGLLRFGRCPCFWISGVAYIVGPVIMATAIDWEFLALGRLVVGLGIGVSAVAAPAYLGEIAPVSMRGAVVATYEVMLCLGLLCASFTNFLLQWVDTNHPDLSPLPSVARWRIMLGLPGLRRSSDGLPCCHGSCAAAGVWREASSPAAHRTAAHRPGVSAERTASRCKRPQNPKTPKE